MTAITRPKSVALIDLSYLFKKNFVTLPGAGPLAAAEATLKYLAYLADGVDHVVLCLDAPPYQRAERYPEYQANRPAPEPEEVAQRKWLRRECQRLGYAMARSEGYEADDCIATLARVYGEWCADVRIVGNDKDAAQCVTENVVQYVPPFGQRDWEVRNIDKVVDKFGVRPEQMAFFQALCGDSTDNVPGVPRVGEVTAARLVNKYRTLTALSEAVTLEAPEPKASAVWKSLATHWNQLVLSFALVTLDVNVPLDAEALLVKHEPVKTQQDDTGVELDGFMGNQVAMPAGEDGVTIADEQFEEAAPRPPIIGKDPGADAALAQLEEENRARYAALERKVAEANTNAPRTPERVAETQARIVAGNAADRERVARAAQDEYQRQRVTDGEFDPISAPPGDKVAEPAAPPPKPASAPAPVAPKPGLVKTTPDWGQVDENLQARDLRGAETLSKWLAAGEIYPQFKTPAQIFTVISRAKEMGIGMHAALGGTHMVDGKPVNHADLIRALAERDPNCEYLYPVEWSATHATWEGKHRKHPRAVPYTYTLEEAKQADLVKLGKYGKPGNWMLRPQDMLMKTAGSKLARLLWPGATLGMYCPEELSDYTMEELRHEREAA